MEEELGFECGLFFFSSLAHRRTTTGLEVTAGTGTRVCPSPAVRVLRHGQMSVKDNLAASWTLQELALLLQFHNLSICHARVHLFTFSVGSSLSYSRAFEVLPNGIFFYGAFQLGWR